MPRYIVTLTSEQVQELKTLIKKAKISFFHNFADSAICNIIDHFQADQLIRDHLYGSPRSTFRRLVTVYGTYPGFHIVSYFAMPIFLYFLARGGFHPIHDKTLGNALDCTAGSSVCVFDMIICPGFVLRLLVQCRNQTMARKGTVHSGSRCRIHGEDGDIVDV